ncbi:MAG: hypothetical protein U0821_16625 [Chloroflexota bacterium]
MAVLSPSLSDQGDPRRTRSYRPWSAFVFLCAFALAAMHVATLASVPAPFVDELWYLSRAIGWLRDGRVMGAVDAGVIQEFDGYWTYFPVASTLYQAAFVYVFGETVLAMRLSSFLAGAWLLAAVYWIGCWVWERPSGVLSAFLVSAASYFVYSSHLGRQDMLVAALGYTALALFLWDGGHRWALKSLLAGLLLGIAVEIHPNGSIFGAGLLACSCVRFGRGVLRAGQNWAVLAGVSLGLAGYLWLHVLPYPDTFLGINRVFFGATHTPPLISGSAEAWITSAEAAWTMYSIGLTTRLPLVSAGGLLVMFAGGSRGRMLGAWLLGLVLGAVGLMRNHHPYYIVLLDPTADILCGYLVARLWFDRNWRGRWVARARLGASVLCIAPVVWMLPSFSTSALTDFELVQHRLQTALPPESSVMASPVYWLAVRDHLFWNWGQLAYWRAYRPGDSLRDAVAAYKPDYFVVDSEMEQFLGDESDLEGLSHFQRFYFMSRSQMDDLLRARGTLISESETSTYGSMRIYKLRWD